MAQIGLGYKTESGSFEVKVVFIDGETIQVKNAVRYKLLLDANVYVIDTTQGAPLFINSSQVKYIGTLSELNGEPDKTPV